MSTKNICKVNGLSVIDRSAPKTTFDYQAWADSFDSKGYKKPILPEVKVATLDTIMYCKSCDCLTEMYTHDAIECNYCFSSDMEVPSDTRLELYHKRGW